MLVIRLDSPVPLGEQILIGLRSLIAREKLGPGDELPPVRQLASDLGINLNTVARAYKELEREGLVSSVRGRGTRITSSASARQGHGGSVREGVRSQIERAISDAKLGGMTQDEVEALMREMVGEFWRGADSETADSDKE